MAHDLNIDQSDWNAKYQTVFGGRVAGAVCAVVVVAAGIVVCAVVVAAAGCVLVGVAVKIIFWLK